ncbi:RANBP1C [Scenedesmus sp. PABB004]|nr:RANBP1C [Scenedesmus sp. PABB004]
MATEAAAPEVKEEPKPTPVFGAGTFGGATGFAGFTGVPASSSDGGAAGAGAGGEGGDEDDAAAAEEECQAEYKPVVQLEEVETSTGEEDEQALVELKCKLYRFEAAGNEWKERGLGVVKLLKHKENQKIRLLMRQEKTLKIRANHIVMPTSKLQEHAGSDKAWVWSAVDYADGEHKVELFCVRFGSPEKAQEFKKKFDEAAESNAAIINMAAVPAAAVDGTADAADALADELGKTKVADGGDAAPAAAEAAEPKADMARGGLMLAVLLPALLARLGSVSAAFVLSESCPGNLIVNGDFEAPNTMLVPSEHRDKYSNSRWGWHRALPGWYTTRPDGLPCVKVDWQSKWIEIARGALAKPIEGQQYAELLPNGTGNYCQELALQKGATYRLSYYYGRLITFTEGEGRGAHGTGKLTPFDTAVDVAVRPAGHAVSASAAPWPKDRQGFTVIDSADTAADYAAHQTQWVRHETTFTAPDDKVTLAFINTKRSKVCGSCGSLLDAVCLQKA